MERLSDTAITIINDLHTERLDYQSEYLPLIDAVNRLADYEDTGLEPEEIEKALSDCAEVVIRNQFAIKDIQALGGIDHLRDLVQAEKDGRLVVLPCKVGTLVYRLGASICKWRDIDRCDSYCSGYEYEDCWEGERVALEEKFNLNMIGSIGKTVFLTREEAEAALKGENHETDTV